jgi:hypothetical protein
MVQYQFVLWHPAGGRLGEHGRIGAPETIEANSVNELMQELSAVLGFAFRRVQAEDETDRRTAPLADPEE